MFYILIFIFGAIIGSFLNVVILRLQTPEKIIKSRSKCPKCHQQLGLKDLIPIVSFVWQRGRCRYCQQPISWQYPIVELATGFLFVLATYNLIGNLGWADLFYDFSVFLNWLRNLIFIGFLVIIFVYDLKYYLILDQITFPAMAVAIIFNLFLGFSWLNLLIGLIIGLTFFALQLAVSDGRWLGAGDLRLGALMGLMLGGSGTVVALFFSYIIGAVIAVFLIIWGKKELKSQIPLGTFLAIGTLIALWWGQSVVNWYISFL